MILFYLGHLPQCSFPGSLFIFFLFFFCLTFYIGLAHHICSLLAEAVALYLEADDKRSTKTANVLLLSLLDILQYMLTYTANIVRQTLQVWD